MVAKGGCYFTYFVIILNRMHSPRVKILQYNFDLTLRVGSSPITMRVEVTVLLTGNRMTVAGVHLSAVSQFIILIFESLSLPAPGSVETIKEKVKLFLC
jgi:hypothetical protein